MTKLPVQLYMFPLVHQTVRQGRTSLQIWEAVLTLRKVGKRVYACGRQHKVDDWLVDDAGLLRLARPFMMPPQAEGLKKLSTGGVGGANG